MDARDSDRDLVGEFIRSILKSLEYIEIHDPETLLDKQFKFSYGNKLIVDMVQIRISYSIYASIRYWANGNININISDLNSWHQRVNKEFNIASPDATDILSNLLRYIPPFTTKTQWRKFKRGQLS